MKRGANMSKRLNVEKNKKDKFVINSVKKAILITGLFFVLSCCWIVFTDLIVSRIFGNEDFAFINIIKGLLYVAITSFLMFVLLFTSLKRLLVTQYSLQQLNESLKSERQKLIDSDKKLKESEALFRTIFDQAPIGIYIGHKDGIIVPKNYPFVTVNNMYKKITGRTTEQLTQVSWEDITHPQDLGKDKELFEKFLAGEITNYDMEKRYIRPDGSTIWVHVFINPLKFEDNADITFLCLVQDISRRKSIEQALYESERSKSVLLSNLPGLAYRCKFDKDWTMEFVSQGCFDLTGYKAESLINNKEISFNKVIAPQYREQLWNQWLITAKEHKQFRYEYEIITADNQKKWVLELGQVIYEDDNETIEALEGIIIDITDRKEKELQIKYINEHEFISGLHNRRYFEELLSSEIDLKENYTVVSVNLNKFNMVNLAHGYRYAENLIKKVSLALSNYCNEKVMLFHIAYERFAFLLKGFNKSEITDLCKRLLNSLQAVLVIDSIGANIGVFEIIDENLTAENIIQNSIIAAESNCNDNFAYSFYNEDIEATLKRTAAIKQELTKISINPNDDSLYLEFQPIINTKNNSIYGFEALARLKSDKLKVSPAEFIPIAEETQLIVPIGKKILYMALSFLKQLQQQNFNDIKVSLNISIVQLFREDFYSDLINAINEFNVNAANIIIEITETVFAGNYNEINEKLKKFKSLGIKIAIDDFGTGYSSLARERELNVDILKIDKSFIDKLLLLDFENTITCDIISMAHKLGHSVIAEGVEQEKQKQYLAQHNCDCMQGYLFSKPIDSNTAFELINKYNN